MSTIIEIKNQLISHFYDYESFNLENDSAKINLSDDLSSVKKDTIETVMLELEKLNMVTRVSYGKEKVWILNQPFDTYNQSVVLSAHASEIIGETINSFRDANDIDGDICDKTKITESDIVNLINICHVLLEDAPKDEKERDRDENDDIPETE